MSVVAEMFNLTSVWRWWKRPSQSASPQGVKFTVATVPSSGHPQLSYPNSGFIGESESNLAEARSSSKNATNVTTSKLGQKLNLIKLLYDQRRMATDLAVIFALVGTILMIIEIELVSNDVYSRDSSHSNIMRSFICLSTVVLLLFILRYHWFDAKLFLVSRGIKEWQLAISVRRVLSVLVEVVVCGICPIPGNFYYEPAGGTGEIVKVPLDIPLGIPMFVYLIARLILMHSKMFTQPARRTIGAVNRVNFHLSFCIKTVINDSPGKFLSVVTIGYWLISSWIVMTCERYYVCSVPCEGTNFKNFSNALYLIAITFLTVGYGDITPRTHCGRTVAILSGIMGNLINSLVVALIATKMRMTSTEKLIHDALQEVELTRKLKHAAANVIGKSWQIHRSLKHNSVELRSQKRKLIDAVQRFRHLKSRIRETVEPELRDLGAFSDPTAVDTRLDLMDSRMDTIGTQLSRVIHLLEKSNNLSISSRLNSRNNSLLRPVSRKHSYLERPDNFA